MIYRIRAFKNYNGWDVDENYNVRCGAHLNPPENNRTSDVNVAYRCAEDLNKSCPKGYYIVEEVQ